MEQLTDTELLYLKGLVADDKEAFSSFHMEQEAQRSRFTNNGLQELYDKLEKEATNRELDT